MKKHVWILSMMLVLSSGFIAPVIADCPDEPMSCWGPPLDQGGARIYCGNITIGTCYDASKASCVPCDFKNSNNCANYISNCNSRFPNCCKGNCWTAYKNWFSYKWTCSHDDTWMPPFWP